MSEDLAGRRQLFRAIRAAMVAIAPEPPNLDHAAAARLGGTGPAEAPAETMIDILGSGFFADATDLVVTAYHVIQDWTDGVEEAQRTGASPPAPINVAVPIKYYTEGGDARNLFARTTVVDYSYDAYHDVALLQVYRGPPDDPKFTIEPLIISAEACQEGDQIIMCGYPLGTDLLAAHGPSLLGPSFTSAIVSASLPFPDAPREFQHYFRINGWIQGGNSGGPVTDVHSGHVVGVVTDTVRNHIGSVEGYGRASRSHWVERLIKHHKSKPPVGRLSARQ
jgi:S1-C subfamily serine protease